MNGVPFRNDLELARLQHMPVLLAVSCVRCRRHNSVRVTSAAYGPCAVTDPPPLCWSWHAADARFDASAVVAAEKDINQALESA